MDIDLITDPNLIPKPRDEIKFVSLSATLLTGGTRIRIDMALTPFAPTDRPNIEITAFDPLGKDCASVNIIETMHHHLSLTMHLREQEPTTGTYRIQADLFFEEAKIQHSLATFIDLPGSATPTP